MHRLERIWTYNASDPKRDREQNVRGMDKEDWTELAVEQRKEAAPEEERRAKERKEVDERKDLQQRLNPAGVCVRESFHL